MFEDEMGMAEPFGEPPVPPDLLDEWGPPDLLDEWGPPEEDEGAPSEEDVAEWESYLGRLSAAERFEVQFGLPAVPGSALIAGNASEDAAAFAQEVAVQADRMRTLAEAHRIATLLTAYEVSLADLGERFGPGFGLRIGLGAQAFFRSFGLLVGAHPNRVAHEVDTAVLLRDRLPVTWAVFQRGEASWTRVQTVARQADGLDDAQWAAYDAKAAGLVIRSTRLKDDLRKARERLQDDTAANRARTTHERRRTSLEACSDGGAAFVAEGLAADWVPVNDALHKAAVAAHGVPGETRGIAQLRHAPRRTAVMPHPRHAGTGSVGPALDLLREGLRRAPGQADGDRADGCQAAGLRVPNRKPVEVTLVLTVPALAWLGKSKEQAQLAGYGPVDLETAKDLAGSARSFLRVLTHPVTGVRLTMDQQVYSPPADLARWVRIRDGRSRFPGSTRPAHLSDIDHAREWQHGGATDAGNLVTLDRSSHNLKSAGLFEEELLDTGAIGWNDAWGHRFEDPPGDPLDPAPPELLPDEQLPDEQLLDEPPVGEALPDEPCPF